MRGTPNRGRGRNRSDRDHPRICGEHTLSGMGPAFETGSSPHMRGTLVRKPTRDTERRIIPAYAGNTIRGGCRRWRIRDHPRICGEHIVREGKHHGLAGSSPHMRGTLCGRIQRETVRRDHPRICGEHPERSNRMRWVWGIIPAYAGNTCEALCQIVDSGDHPRICGEH